MIVPIILPYPRERGPTTEYRPTPHFELSFLLRSQVYLNKHLYGTALEYARAITINFSGYDYDCKTEHCRYLVLKHSIRLARPSSLAIYQVIFRSHIDYLKYKP